MKTALLKKLHEAVAEWARIHNIETNLIEVKPSGIASGVHILVVARRGFENWRWSERERDLFRFLRPQFNGNGDFAITRLETMTEEEYEKYADVEA
jgi:hypothetical protein